MPPLLLSWISMYFFIPIPIVDINCVYYCYRDNQCIGFILPSILMRLLFVSWKQCISFLDFFLYEIGQGGRSLRPHRPRGGLQQFWKLKHLRENLYEKSRQVSILLKNIKPDQKLPQLLGLVFSLQPDISIPNGSFFRFFDIYFYFAFKIGRLNCC